MGRREVLRLGGLTAAGAAGAAVATVVGATPADAAKGPVLRSGLATVPIGVRSVTVNVSGLTGTSGAIAMTQGDGALTGSCVVDPAAGTLTIWLIGVRDFPVNVAWLVFL
jgi:hypothetical protein